MAQVAPRKKKQKNQTTRIAGRGAVLLAAGLTAVATGIVTSDPIITHFGLLFLVVTLLSYFVCR